MSQPSDFEPNDQKHAESVQKYPDLNLSDGEFVVADVRRHPIGLFSIWFVTLLIIGFIIASVVLVYMQARMIGTLGVSVNPDIVLVFAMLLSILVAIFGYIGSYIYRANRFYVTNESVIQSIRTSLFSGRQQTIALGGVEDASFRQNGILQYILGYGTIRLSTVGDETTYNYSVVDRPEQQLRVLTDAVEAFKRRHVYESEGV